MVNLHFSLLPRWRGAAPVERAILAGDERDRRRPHGGRGGPRHRRRVRRRRGRRSAPTRRPTSCGPACRRRAPACWSTNLARRASATRRRRWASRPTPHKIDPTSCALDWTGPAVDLHRLVRVGGAWTTFGGARLKVWRTAAARAASAGPGALDRGSTCARRRRPRPAGRGAARGQGAACRPPPGPTGARRRRRRARTVTDRRPARTRVGDARDTRAARVALGPAGGARRPRPHRRRGRLRQPRAAGRARALRAATTATGAFVTELVYGTTRMRRACDFLVDRFLARPVDAPGAQRPAPRRLPARLRRRRRRTPRWARPSGVAPRPARGLVNAVLAPVSPTRRCRWPDDATRLSVPDWIVDRLTADLGAGDARWPPLEAMNEPATVTERADGYVQDPASQWVADRRRRRAGRAGRSTCAPRPGGKATALAARGRAGSWPPTSGPAGPAWCAANAARTGAERRGGRGGRRHPPAVAARVVRPGAGRRPVLGPRRAAAAGRRALAGRRPTASTGSPPCSGGCSARPPTWCGPAALLVYSVCTLTVGRVDGRRRLAGRRAARPRARRPPDGAVGPVGAGRVLLPQAAGTDGMCLFRYRRDG